MKLEYPLGGAYLRRLAGLALLLVVALSGCALTPSIAYDPQAPLTANLPLRLSGIADERLEFAERFKAELNDSEKNKPARRMEDFIYPPGAVKEGATVTEDRVHPDMSATAVLVVPGLFGECVDQQALPFTDGRLRDRSLAYTTAYEPLRARLGAYSVAAVRLAGRGSSETNAVIIAHDLTALQDDKSVSEIIVIAYSKGTADTLHALALLQREGHVPSKPVAFASVAGAVMGTPVADRYAPLYTALQGLIDVDACPGSQGADFNSLTRAYRSRWLADATLPSQVAMYSLVAHAPRELVAPALLPFYDLLSLMDPRNDGQIIAGDAILPGSTILAELRSDHWDLAVPLAVSSNPLMRGLTTGREYPRDVLFRTIVRHLVVNLRH